MSRNILLTGVSGYLGGTLLARLSSADLPPFKKLYVLVRTEEQAGEVRTRYNGSGGLSAEPLRFDPYDAAAVRENVVGKAISIVFHLIDRSNTTSRVAFIKALAEVKRKFGDEVHFLQTSGAKMFSSHAGSPADRHLLDSEPGLFEMQRTQKAPLELMATAMATNCDIIQQAEDEGVRLYTFVPCMVYGQGEGFGNPISIQTVAIVKAAKATGRVYKTDEERSTWPVCHVLDNTSLYLALLRAMLYESNPDYGRDGFYLASSGSVAWDDLYTAMARSLLRHGAVDSDEVLLADQAALERMGAAIGVPPELVNWALAGKCTFTADRGKRLGWAPAYRPEHIIETADEEVDLILRNLK